jgi:hypothetical protein
MAAVPKIDLSKVLADEQAVPDLGLGPDGELLLEACCTSA